MQGRQYFLRKRAQLDAMLVDQGVQGLGVAEGKFADHGQVGGLGGFVDHRLEVIGQRIPGIQVDRAFQHRAGFIPGRGVVVVSHLMQTKGQIIVGPHPVGGIEHAGLQGGEDLATRNGQGGHADPGHRLAGEPWQTQLEALHILERVDFLLEPASHLGAGVTHRERLEVVVGVELVPQLLAAAVVQPGVGLGGGHAEGHGGKELRSRDLAPPVVGSGVAHLGGSLGHGVKDLHRRYHLAGTMDPDLHASAGHPLDALCQIVGSGAEGRKVLGPGRHHVPGDGFLCAGGIDEGGGGHAGGAEAGCPEEGTTFHGASS